MTLLLQANTNPNAETQPPTAVEQTTPVAPIAPGESQLDSQVQDFRESNKAIAQGYIDPSLPEPSAQKLWDNEQEGKAIASARVEVEKSFNDAPKS